MRSQVVNSLRRLGKRAEYDVSALNNDLPIKFIKDCKSVYGFQIGDGIRKFDLKALYESDCEHKIYLVTGLDKPFMEKVVEDLAKEYPDLKKVVRFVSVKEHRNSMESGLSQEIFGTMKYASVPRPNTKYSGSMSDIDMKAGLVITKLGKENGYHVRNPDEGRFIWYLADDVTKVLEVMIGNGFRFINVRKLNGSSAKKKMYLATRLYGKLYKEATDGILGAFPETMIEFMSVAEVESIKELQERLETSILGDLQVMKRVKDMTDSGVWEWADEGKKVDNNDD